jgi:hypothetical protein
MRLILSTPKNKAGEWKRCSHFKILKNRRSSKKKQRETNIRKKIG